MIRLEYTLSSCRDLVQCRSHFHSCCGFLDDLVLLCVYFMLVDIQTFVITHS